MFIGHLAVGFIAKPIAPKVSLGTLMAASLFPDLLWSIFLITGLEHARIKPGITAANPLDLYDYPISHSLLMDAIWAALLATAYFLRKHYVRGAWMLFAAVLSHWLLDFASHRADMPLAPGVHRYFGLGLYNSIGAIYTVEGLLWLIAVIVYARATRPKGRIGVYAFWSVIVLLTVAWLGGAGGTPPPDLFTIVILTLITSSAVVAFAYWVDRLRPAIFCSAAPLH